MADLLSAPFKGESSIPHAREEGFRMYFAGVQLAFLATNFPGRFPGTPIVPYLVSSDVLAAVAEENRQYRDVRAKRRPRRVMPAPREGPNVNSWPKQWWNWIHHRSWERDRMGGGWARPF